MHRNCNPNKPTPLFFHPLPPPTIPPLILGDTQLLQAIPGGKHGFAIPSSALTGFLLVECGVHLVITDREPKRTATGAPPLDEENGKREGFTRVIQRAKVRPRRRWM